MHETAHGKARADVVLQPHAPTTSHAHQLHDQSSVHRTRSHLTPSLFLDLMKVVQQDLMASTKLEREARGPTRIPTVDFARWSQSTNSSERLSVAKSLVSACQEVGFVYIVHHGLSPAHIEDAFATSKSLFAPDHAAKMHAPHPDGPTVHRGYSHPGLEKESKPIRRR